MNVHPVRDARLEARLLADPHRREVARVAEELDGARGAAVGAHGLVGAVETHLGVEFGTIWTLYVVPTTLQKGPTLVCVLAVILRSTHRNESKP